MFHLKNIVVGLFLVLVSNTFLGQVQTNVSGNKRYTHVDLVQVASQQQDLENQLQSFFGIIDSLGGLDSTLTETLLPWTCGDLVEYEGHSYATTEINNTCWFAENCRYLPTVSPSTAASYSPLGYVYNYQGTSVDSAKATFYYNEYGALYNWAATQGWPLCPNGWHVPSDSEYASLVEAVGVDSGTKLKAAEGWAGGGNGTDDFGWAMLPSGTRSRSYNVFTGEGSGAALWTRSVNGNYQAYVWSFYSGNTEAVADSYYQVAGAAARCVKD